MTQTAFTFQIMLTDAKYSLVIPRVTHRKLARQFTQPTRAIHLLSHSVNLVIYFSFYHVSDAKSHRKTHKRSRRRQET